MSKNNLQTINNELKGYINEASFISDKCKTKLIKLISKHFQVDLPVENYLRIDITIKENGNIVMKDEEYETDNKVQNEEELLERYNSFKEEVLELLKKKEVNFDSKRKKNDILNLLITILLTLCLIAIAIYSIRELLYGNIIGFLWILLVIVPMITSKVRNRYIDALRIIKSLFKK